ncbi:amidase [Elioraea tepidiphila]|uniref:amidase n=1 Tax=Elioraea tepidiphila TaxID=457934 RepID=UPI00037D0FC0|nr:amidase [Elioraea tepidiphila]
MSAVPTIAEAARAIAARSLSPVELMRDCIGRVERLEPTLHAFVALDGERAMEAARNAEARIMRDGPRGPLDGIPVAHKDIVDVAGLPTTACSHILVGNVATRDAAVVRRWAEAGAISLGKLTTHEFAWGGPSFDLPTPPARNPWNPEHFTAGSSSGTGAAVASGMILGGTGSDTGGSIRGPAALCGLAGIKPTYGLVPRTGVVPLAWSMDHVGPLAWTVEDCALLLQAAAGHDPEDPGSAARPVPDLVSGLGGGVKGLRIGVVRHFHETDVQVSPATRRGIDEAARLFGELGASVRDVTLPPLAEFWAPGMTLLLGEAFAVHAHWVRTQREKYGEILRERLLLGALISGEHIIAAQRMRRRLAEAVGTVMRDVDLLLTAAAMGEAPRIDAVDRWIGFKTPSLTIPFNLTGQPALTVCSGLGEGGLPVAIQLAGRPWEDTTVLRAGHAYEQVRGALKRPAP